MWKSGQNNKIQWTILLIYGLWHTFEQWTRILLPFAQWHLQPTPGMYETLLLNSIANGAVFIGIFFLAQLIDSIGGKRTALLSTICTGAFQIGYGWIGDYYGFGAFQLLLLFNNMPTIADAIVGQFGAEIIDIKERSRLMAKLTIPASIAFATGPLAAIQFFYWFESDIAWIQCACGIFHIVTMMPIIIFLLPQNDGTQSIKKAEFANIRPFLEILKDPTIRWTLLFIMMIAGPYYSYDQIIRLHLIVHMLTKPSQMVILALLLALSSLVTNFLVLPYLQRRYETRRIVQLAIAIMATSYFYLIHVTDYQHVMLGMPFQVIGLSLSMGPLAAQMMGSVPRSQIGKAAALSRLAQIAATTMTPLVVGIKTEQGEVSTLCSINIFICFAAIALIEFYGRFMGKCTFYDLPVSTHVE